MKKFIFIIIILLVGIFYLFIFFLRPKEAGIRPKQPIPTPTIFTKQVITPVIPTEMLQEKIGQEVYSAEREKYLKDKPWILRMPIKGDGYFISYDPSRNEILATIYFSNAITTSRQEQLETSKKNALKAIELAGIDLKIERVVFFETQK